MVVKDEERKKVTLLVENPGNSNFHKDMGANVPGRYLHVDRFSKKDLKVIDFSVKNNLEYIALSFTRDAEDVQELDKVIRQAGKKYDKRKKPTIILKIEDKYGIENLEKILVYARKRNIKLGVMVARGDMTVELPYYKMPAYQKYIINKCKEYRVPVAVATGLLCSMTENNHPARAEISDVANAVLDGSDALMLSAETSNSQNPVLAVKTLSEIAREYMPKHPQRTRRIKTRTIPAKAYS